MLTPEDAKNLCSAFCKCVDTNREPLDLLEKLSELLQDALATPAPAFVTPEFYESSLPAVVRSLEHQNSFFNKDASPAS